MESRCRLCFEQRTDMERIFPDRTNEEDVDDVDWESPIAIKIFKCTSLQLPVDDDDLTSSVCKQCLSRLDEFFQFRVDCRKNNIRYRKRNKPPAGAITSGTASGVATDGSSGIGPDDRYLDFINDPAISLEKLDETLLRALAGKDVELDPSKFDETFIGSEIKPEDLLKASMAAFAAVAANNDDSVIDEDMDDADLKKRNAASADEAVSSSSARCDGCGGEFTSAYELNQHAEYCAARMKATTMVQGPPSADSMSPNFGLSSSTASGSVSVAAAAAAAAMTANQMMMDLTCYTCNKTCSSIQELKYHEAMHASAALKCNFCLQTFNCSRTLKFHMDQHKVKNTLPDGRFKCDLCEATFKLYGNLIIHRRSHTGERPYPCNICGRAFSTSSNMKTHMNVVHSQDRPYKCQHCYKCFNTESRLRSHMETHAFSAPASALAAAAAAMSASYYNPPNSQNDAGAGSGSNGGSSATSSTGGEYSSTCKICNKTFSHPSYLTIHYRVHTGERPYQCKYCPSAFATSGNLKVHMRIHAALKVRPYKCNMCPKSFLHASNLSVHKKTQHY